MTPDPRSIGAKVITLDELADGRLASSESDWHVEPTIAEPETI